MIVCDDIEQQNIAEVAAFITSLTGAGAKMFPDREIENHMRTLAELPLAPEDGEEDGMTDAMNDEIAQEVQKSGQDEGAEDGPATRATENV